MLGVQCTTTSYLKILSTLLFGRPLYCCYAPEIRSGIAPPHVRLPGTVVCKLRVMDAAVNEKEHSFTQHECFTRDRHSAESERRTRNNKRTIPARPNARGSDCTPNNVYFQPLSASWRGSSYCLFRHSPEVALPRCCRADIENTQSRSVSMHQFSWADECGHEKAKLPLLMCMHHNLLFACTVFERFTAGYVCSASAQRQLTILSSSPQREFRFPALSTLSLFLECCLNSDRARAGHPLSKLQPLSTCHLLVRILRIMLLLRVYVESFLSTGEGQHVACTKHKHNGLLGSYHYAYIEVHTHYRQLSCPADFPLRDIITCDFKRLKKAHASLLPIPYENDFFIKVCGKELAHFGLCAEGDDPATLAGFATARQVGIEALCPNDRRALNASGIAVDDKSELVYVLTIGVSSRYRRRGLAHSLMQGIVRVLPLMPEVITHSP